MRFIGTLALALLVTVTCTETKKEKTDTIVVGLESAPANLDSRYATDAHSQYIGRLIYSALIQYDKNAKIQPDLALRWDIVSPTHYRFYLRKDVFFHDGTKLTAADVKATYENILDPKLDPPSPRSHGYKKIKSITLKNPYTLDFILTEAHAPFLGDLVIGIQPAAMLKAKQHRIVGTGPYQLVTHNDSQIKLLHNSRYFNGSPKTPHLLFKVVKDINTRYFKLLEGSLDLVQNSLPKDRLDELSKNKSLTVLKDKGLNTAYMGFNCKDPILKHIAVRQAIAHAINKYNIIKYELNNLAEEAISILPPFSPYFEPKQKRYSFNLKEANRLLDSAGFKRQAKTGQRFSLRFKTFNNKTNIGIAKLIGAQLAKIGITVKIDSYEWGTFYKDIKNGDFQMYTLRWVGMKDPDHYHYIFNSKSIPNANQSGGNRGRYQNIEIDTLTNKGRVTTLTADRKKIYSRVQTIVAAELPYVNLWHTYNFVALRKNIRGFELYPDGHLISLRKAFKVVQ